MTVIRLLYTAHDTRSHDIHESRAHTPSVPTRTDRGASLRHRGPCLSECSFVVMTHHAGSALLLLAS